jgi:hypothetical protein
MTDLRENSDWQTPALVRLSSQKCLEVRIIASLYHG